MSIDAWYGTYGSCLMGISLLTLFIKDETPMFVCAAQSLMAHEHCKSVRHGHDLDSATWWNHLPFLVLL